MNHYGCLAQLSLPKPVGTPCIIAEMGQSIRYSFICLQKLSILIVSDCCEKMSNQALKDFRISFKITQVFLQEKDQKFVDHSLLNLIFCDILFNLVAKYWISIHLSFSQSRLWSKHEVTITMLT